MRTNYHTHTKRCKHATGSVGDYVRVAQESGMEAIGISDHAALPDNDWIEIRMSFDELDDYIREIDESRERFKDIKILKAMECEYREKYVTYFREDLLGERNFDYLIGAAHYFLEGDDWKSCYAMSGSHQMRAYTNYFIQSMESGLFAFMAHPDVFAACGLDWDPLVETCCRDMLSAAEALDMPLEINGLGLRKAKVRDSKGERAPYPWLPFWELAAEYRLQVICNSDAHHPVDVTRGLKETSELALKLGLKQVDLLDILEG